MSSSLESYRKYVYFCAQFMKKVTNPLVWLARFRHRKGYGVHSPFAFRFITDVIYERQPYYAYRELDKALPFSKQFRQRKGYHLLLRIANHLQPETILLPKDAWWEKRYLQSGCKRARIKCEPATGEVSMCLLREPADEVLQHLGEQSVLLLDNLHRHREWFRNLPSVVSFDLYDLGIAFFDKQYNKQYYKVNF
jgi:hypothetical protein